MRLIPAVAHRVLDFVTVVAFALAPSVLGLPGPAAALSYVLALVHLTMTLLTRFSPEERGPVPLGLHGAVESLVGVTLIALPWLVKWHGVALFLYVSAGMVILAVGAASQYRMAQPRVSA
jgi:hypothetical protein